MAISIRSGASDGGILLNGVEIITFDSTGITKGGIAAGTVIDFAGTSAPDGYLALPTTATDVSRTTYAALFAAIGTTWGAGDGSTTFGLPYVPADYASVQANANVGTSTSGVVIAHTHMQNGNGGTTIATVGGFAPTANASGGAVRDTLNTDSTGGAANLAAGIRFLKCIKI